MNIVQIYIMWAGIISILVLAAQGQTVYFWRYTLVVALITAGLIVTVEVVKRSKSKGRQEK